MRSRFLLTALLALLLAAPALAADRLVLATTTSTANTGLLDVLLPAFTKQSGVTVHYIPVGTGKALAIAKRCDADVVIVHAPELEKRFVADGYGVDRKPLMHNYFVLVGPPGDPAQVKQAGSVREALKRIAQAQAPFLSRGDNSGTQVKELALWKAAGIKPDWPAYREAGRGMGPTLTMADELKAYTISDIATYRKYQSTGRIQLAILADQQDLLKNLYSVILVNPAKCPKAKAGQARAFEKFLLSPQGQKIIGDFKADGKRLFWPAHPAK
ncbi:MAG: substrate-binding domain-containing protein [Proteobacteria bacterium]|nr:substrate-binding domain-containing protein [Pseudomonadota bacterium]MBU1452421.1 substrate-binding domain-containing protein [Pseudomonadota bacterium]MBU2467688.1 substrate-binding domain-containing protein [Pseudomonadota bacterium]MBU2518240.1 substrate-binding domain-containing protein [Pseudomonadota bacterium]